MQSINKINWLLFYTKSTCVDNFTEKTRPSTVKQKKAFPILTASGFEPRFTTQQYAGAILDWTNGSSGFLAR